MSRLHQSLPTKCIRKSMQKNNSDNVATVMEPNHLQLVIIYHKLLSKDQMDKYSVMYSFDLYLQSGSL